MALASTDKTILMRTWNEGAFKHGYEYTDVNGVVVTSGVFKHGSSVTMLANNLREMGYDVQIEHGKWERTWVPDGV